MTIITPITGGAGVVPLGALARGHHTVRSRALAGEAGEFAGGWAETDLHLPEDVYPDATLDLLFREDWKTYTEPAGQGYGGVFSTPDAALTFDRNSEAGRFDPAGLFESVAADVLRRDYDPATLAARGALIEAAVAYQGVNSDLAGGNASTPPTGISTPAPTGIIKSYEYGTAFGAPYVDVKLDGTATSTDPLYILFGASTSFAASAGDIWTGAAWVQLIRDTTGCLSNLSMRVDAYTGAGAYISSGGLTSFWSTASAAARRSTTFTLPATTGFARPVIISSSVASGTAVAVTIRVWLPRFTKTPYVPSPLLVGTSAVTRLADSLSLPLGSWFNPLAGTLLAEVVIPYTLSTGYAGLASISDGTLANRVTLAHYHGNGLSADGVISGSVGQAVFTTGAALVAGAVRKQAITWAANDVQDAVDGALSAVDTSATIPSGMTRLDIGALTASANNPLNGWVRRITYWPYRMAGAEMQARTAA